MLAVTALIQQTFVATGPLAPMYAPTARVSPLRCMADDDETRDSADGVSEWEKYMQSRGGADIAQTEQLYRQVRAGAQ